MLSSPWTMLDEGWKMGVGNRGVFPGIISGMCRSIIQTSTIWSKLRTARVSPGSRMFTYRKSRKVVSSSPWVFRVFRYTSLPSVGALYRQEPFIASYFLMNLYENQAPLSTWPITLGLAQTFFRGIEWSLRAFTSTRALRLSLRARAVFKFVLRAASTLKNTTGEKRTLRNTM